MGCCPSGDAGKVEELTREVSTRDSSIAKLKVDLDNSFAKAKREEDEIEALRGERDSLKTAHASCAATISSLEEAKASISSELSNLSHTIEDLQRELEAHKKQKSDLEAELLAASQANSQTTAALEAQISQQADAISSLMKQLEDEKERANREIEEARAAGGSKKHRDCLKLSPKCKIGSTGKYYCGKKMENEDDICGPLKGSNCRKCQALDVDARDLPRGFLVNADGRICRHGSDGVNWFCGAGVMHGIPGCDGYCGPTNGPNCQACQEMQHLAESRYSKLLS